MTSRVLKIITGAFQILFAIPFIGIFISSGIPTSVFMLILHGVTIYLALREKSTILGNILGLVAALLTIVQSTFFHSIGILIVLYFLFSWFLHVLSASLIFYGLKQDKETEGKKRIIDTHQAKKQEEQWQEKSQSVIQSEQQLSSEPTEQKQQSDKQTDFSEESPSSIKRQVHLTRKQSLLQEKERIEQSILSLHKRHEEGMEFAIDSSVVLQKHSFLILEYFLKNKAINIYISSVVMEELNELKTNKKQIGKAAEQALLFIQQYEQQLNVLDQVEKDFLQYRDLSTRNDDRLIGSYVQLQESHDKKILFLTNVATLKKKAKAYQLDTVIC